MNETRVVTKLMREFDDSYTIDRYHAQGGYQGLRRALEMAPQEVVEVVKNSGLRGRGGAGFPTGDKWSFLPEGQFPRYVVVNDDEGEPCTFKDRELSMSDPHAIIEGALICAYAVGAEAIYIYVRGEFAEGARRISRAIADATAAGYVGQQVLGTKFGCPVYIHPGAGAYICGEETALLESLEGYRGQPRLRPPFYPAAKGLYQNPTVVNNVETLANLPHILVQGAAWFRRHGTEQSPGTRVFSVAGAVNRPGNYEFELGVRLADVVAAAGGVAGEGIKAVIPGGASAPWLDTDDFTLDFETLDGLGSMLGSGSVILLGQETCAVRAAFNITRFFNHESCGKCTPCREGTWWGLKVLERLEAGEGRADDLEILIDVCNNMSDDGPRYRPMGRSFCALGDGAAWSLRSAIKLFRDEFTRHATEGGCPYEKKVDVA